MAKMSLIQAISLAVLTLEFESEAATLERHHCDHWATECRLAAQRLTDFKEVDLKELTGAIEAEQQRLRRIRKSKVKPPARSHRRRPRTKGG